ncbi:MAG: hypothetical protein P1V97_02390 [Planctomycetota bacterium]|nr:hypothetical protein [Planctomycetota bacterium]
MAAETTDKPLGAPLILGVLSLLILIGVVVMLLPDSNGSKDEALFNKNGPVQDTSKALKRAPTMKPGATSDSQSTEKKTISPEAQKRLSLVKGLRARFAESDLKLMVRASLKIEKRAREDLGETDAAYEKMDADWAKLCKEKGISEAERDALEDEALRQAWIQPLKNDN